MTGRYCSECGQDSHGLPTRVAPLAGLFLAHATGLEGRGVRSLINLMVRPGRLTRSYLDGRRVRYTDPVQLYLWCTAGFFLLHAFSPVVRLNAVTGDVESTLSAVSVRSRVSSATLQLLTANGVSPAVLSQRFDAAVSASLPVLLVALVGASALLMALQFWKEAPLTHLIFALHWSAFYFTLEAARQLLQKLGPWGVNASVLGSLMAIVYLVVAMRLVYRRSWLGSGLRALVSISVFAALLAAWLRLTTLLAERLV